MFPNLPDALFESRTLPRYLIVSVHDIILDYLKSRVRVQDHLYSKGRDRYATLDPDSVLHWHNYIFVLCLQSFIEIRLRKQLPFGPANVERSTVWDCSRREVSWVNFIGRYQTACNSCILGVGLESDLHYYTGVIKEVV